MFIIYIISVGHLLCDYTHNYYASMFSCYFNLFSPIIRGTLMCFLKLLLGKLEINLATAFNATFAGKCSNLILKLMLTWSPLYLFIVLNSITHEIRTKQSRKCTD